jgi:hypothetical protein
MSDKDNIINFPHEPRNTEGVSDDHIIEQKINDVLDQESKGQDLIECPKCNRPTPDTAPTCPNCHHPVKSHLRQIRYDHNWRRSRKWVLIYGVLATVGLYLSLKISSTNLHRISEWTIAFLIAGVAIRKFQLMYWKEKGFITEGRFWVIECQYIRSLVRQVMVYIRLNSN